MAEFTSILICGGSLAGTACAIRLKQLGHEPVIIDKSAFPRKKLCGEFLGPDAILFLKKLGVWESVEAKAYGPIERIEIYSPSGRRLSIHARWIRKDIPYGVALPREILDELLCQHARSLDIRILEKRTVISYQNADYDHFLVDIETR